MPEPVSQRLANFCITLRTKSAVSHESDPELRSTRGSAFDRPAGNRAVLRIASGTQARAKIYAHRPTRRLLHRATRWESKTAVSQSSKNVDSPRAILNRLVGSLLRQSASAWVACVTAAPALRAADTIAASTSSVSLAPALRALPAWISMQYGHCVV